MKNIYTQSNTTENMILNFKQNENGSLEKVQEIKTGGKGTNGYNIATGEASTPDPLLSSYSVIVSGDKKYLFVANAGDNTVSSFMIDMDGMLTYIDNKSTEREMINNYGHVNTLAYCLNNKTLYVGHSYGANHIVSFKVMDGKLEKTTDMKSVNTTEMSDRILTSISMAPNNKYILADVLFGARANASGITPAFDKNLVVFPILDGGMLGEAMISESGGIAPFASANLNNNKEMFVTVLAAESSVVLSKIDENGMITNSPKAKIDTMRDGNNVEPSELCWISVTADNKYAFGANFGYGTVSSFAIDGMNISVLESQAAMEMGGGDFKGLGGAVSSGAGDCVILDNVYHQLYANASKLVSYKIMSDGKLEKVGEVNIPKNSTQGLAA